MIYALVQTGIGYGMAAGLPLEGRKRAALPLAEPLRTRGTLLTVLGLVACVSNGSAPPAPTQEATSEGRSRQFAQPIRPPLAPPTLPVEGSPPPSSNTVATAAELEQQLRTLPDSVLVGTDVVPLADYLGSAAVIPPRGTFRSEQGGATAEVRLTSGPQGSTLTREFAEPGTRSQTRRYDALQPRANGARLSGLGLEVLGTRSGLLVLEKNSGVDGVPSSLWIEYARKPTGAPAKGE